MKKTITTMLLMLLTATTAGAQEAISGLTYNTADGYYEIPDAAALNALATYVNDGNDASGKTFKQTADIIYDSNFTPIGFNGRSFAGMFYGNGYTISNIVVTGDPSVPGRGLFGKTDGATLDGITVSGIVSGTAGYAGGLVGNAVGTTITNCLANCTVSNTSYYTGGLAGGISEGTTIDGCRADGYTGGNGYVGGFVGYIYGSGTVTISNCVARGDVRSYDRSYGGFVGELANTNATISDCWCSGAIWGTGGDLGAFVGNCRYGVTQDCSVYPYAAGPRFFCGNNINIEGGTLSATDVAALSKDKDGTPWPAVQKHIRNATPIATAEELLAIKDDLAGCYVLVDDIDFDYQTIEPIGNAFTPFTGEFYGQGHKISCFTVNSTEPNVGFFGNIKGGRVNNLRLDGSVFSSPNDTGTTGGIGGFAGRIGSKSLVDDCSFEGQVETDGSGKVGGFVGRTEDSPMILRSCVEDTYISNESSQQFTGGFVGYHYLGFIKDCYATGEVTSSYSDVGGFAGYVETSARIATSWCSVYVYMPTLYEWVGAFVGNVDGNITNSYYDANRTSQLAQGTLAPGGSADYTGITGLDDMSDPNSFDGFDFDTTWEIDEYYGCPVFRRGQQHVTFDPAGGTCAMESKDYAIGGYGGYGYYNNLPVPVRPGYNFLGWFDDYGIQITDHSSVTIDANRTLHARWSVAPWSGSGTEDDPYMIYNKDQLDLLAERVNDGITYCSDESHPDGYFFKLGADIEYDPNVLTIDNDGDGNGDSNYTPIGYCDLDEMYMDPEQGSQIIPVMFPFAGHFDGANHVVSGIRIYKGGTELATDCNQALFGVIGIDTEYGTAEVKNVILADAHITGYDYVSGIVGTSYFGAVSNCHVLSDVTIDAVQDDAYYQGGIMGSNSAGSVTGCTSAATVTINPGCIVSENGGSVSDCLYLGTATALSDDEDNSDILTLLTQRTAALTAVERTTPLSTAVDVTLNDRTLWKDGAWNTLCLPFTVSTTSGTLAGDNVVAMTLDADNSGLSGTTLTLNFDDAPTSIPAGTPFIIKWSKTNESDPDLTNLKDPVFNGVTISSTTPSEVTFDGGQFVGTYSPVELQKEDKTKLYLGAGNKLYWPSAKVTMNAFRAYFDLGEGQEAHEFVLNFDGESTGISSTTNSSLNGGEWYDLQGRRLSGQPTAKGVYIHNSKTVVIK